MENCSNCSSNFVTLSSAKKETIKRTIAIPIRDTIKYVILIPPLYSILSNDNLYKEKNIKIWDCDFLYILVLWVRIKEKKKHIFYRFGGINDACQYYYGLYGNRGQKLYYH